MSSGLVELELPSTGLFSDELIFEKGNLEEGYWRVTVSDFKLAHILVSRLFRRAKAQIAVLPLQKGQVKELPFGYSWVGEKKASLVWVNEVGNLEEGETVKEQVIVDDIDTMVLSKLSLTEIHSFFEDIFYSSVAKVEYFTRWHLSQTLLGKGET